MCEVRLIIIDQSGMHIIDRSCEHLARVFLSAWICPKRQAVPWQAPCTSRLARLRCCVDKRWMAVPPKPRTPQKSPHPKRRRFTTSPHPGRGERALPRPKNPTRKPPSPPNKRTTSTTSTRNPGEGRGKEIYEHYFALNPSPSRPILRLDRPTGPGAH